MEADNYRYNEDMLDDPVLPSMSGESMDLKACLRQRELYEMLSKVTRQLGYEPNASGTYSYRKYAISMVCRALGYHKATRVAQHNRASAPVVNAQRGHRRGGDGPAAGVDGGCGELGRDARAGHGAVSDLGSGASRQPCVQGGVAGVVGVGGCQNQRWCGGEGVRRLLATSALHGLAW